MDTKELIRTVKFVLFSVSAGMIQLGSFALMNELLHWDYWVSYLIALVASVLWNFTFNRRYTFKSDGNVARAMLLFLPIIVCLHRCPRGWSTRWLVFGAGMSTWRPFLIWL